MSLWGSLQKGVASLESRLDVILGETEDVPQSAKQDTTPTNQPPKASAPILEQQNSNAARKTTSNAANDRLQARLAKAIAARASAASSNVPSRSTTPSNIPNSPRASYDAAPVVSASTADESPPTPVQAENTNEVTISSVIEQDAPAFNAARMPILQNAFSAETPNTETTAIESSKRSAPTNLHDAENANVGKDASFQEPVASIQAGTIEFDSSINSTTVEDHSPRVSETLTESQRADMDNRQELHTYMERIDALQAKLQYLSREAVDSARRASASAQSGSPEKKLAQRDEQIALLMEEGQKLSKTEMKHLTVIRGLRSRIAELEKDVSDGKRRFEKLEKDNSASMERLRRADQNGIQINDLEKKLQEALKELSAVIKDRDTKAGTIVALSTQLKDAESLANSEAVAAVKVLLDQERRRTSDLEEQVSSLKIEKELATSRAKVQMDEFRAKSEREAERARAQEMEWKAEQQSLEARLEVLRTRAEEVSSGATGDAQAKLLRQIEQSQSQYATASENWQRIEASITSRAVKLEQERDEAQKRELETRRKARDMNVKSRRIEDEAEEARTKMLELEQNVEQQKHVVERLQKRVDDSEAALVEARKAFELEKQTWTMDNTIHNEESGKSRQHSSDRGASAIRAESPVATMHRGLTAEHLGLQNLQTARRSSARPTTYEASSINRKASSQLIKNGSGRHTPIRNNSQQSLFPPGDVNYAPPSIVGIEPDDEYENIVTPSSPFDKMNDILSVSTIGAGPTVQLVERMSANVRRLENEKLSTREEMVRLSAQRDEARAEIASLMSEIESKKSVEARLKEVEEEKEQTSARYQTTLEMLGEKSELVEELRQDVQDIKDMYRELIERTVK